MKHSKYLDKLRDNKFKHLNMNHRDRDSFLKYISDTNTTCSNVKRRTRRQLNPDQCKFNQLIFFNSFLFSFFGTFYNVEVFINKGKSSPDKLHQMSKEADFRYIDCVVKLREKDEKLTGWLTGLWGPVQNAKYYTTGSDVHKAI